MRLGKPYWWILSVCLLGGCAAGPPPNVLFIAVDDMNDYVSPLGGRAGVETPNLERLAGAGITFTNAHTASPACHPSRVALLTGAAPHRSGISQNHYAARRASWRISPALRDVVTLPQFFRDNGYRVSGGGKIFHALQWSEGTENEPEAWDEYYPDGLDTIPKWPLPAGFDPEKNRAEERHPWFHWQPLEVSDEETSDYKVVDWAIGQMKRQHEKPFFLAVGIFRPHMPWHVPRKYFDMYPPDTLELPEHQDGDLDDTHGHERRDWHKWVLDHDQWPQALQSYLASITYADAQIGRLLDGLAGSGQAANTVIVLWADHGMHLGEKENWEKFTLWEESTRVPLFFVAPEVTKPGSRSTRPVSLLDVYPTLAELSGLAPPEQLDGESLVPLLRDPAAARERPAVTSFRGNNHAVRTERWRYIRYANGDEELYDHETDPQEYTNLAGKPEYAETVKELAVWLPAATAENAYGEEYRPF